MTCQTTDIPSLAEIDIAALQERYRHERDRRLRPEGQRQYAEIRVDRADVDDIDPHMPVTPRAPITEEIDVAVLGAGLTGLMAGVHLRKAGIASFRHFDHAGDFGGCWYWNRYPGIQCDNDAYCYLPMLEEMGHLPSKKFEDGYAIQAYCRQIAERFDLYGSALFHTIITALRWDEGRQRWRITTNRGDDIAARFVVMAGGPLNKPKLPGIPGIERFKGKLFHTARWDYGYSGGEWRNPVLSKLADKRVAIVGTGATAVQAVPYLGKYAGHLYVLQRTPPSVDQRNNLPTDPAWAASLAPGWQKERQRNFHNAAVAGLAPGEPDQICDIWTEINRNMNAELEAEGWPQLTMDQFLERRTAMDFRVMERMRRRVDSIVRDPVTADALKPWFRLNCKRPCSNDDYYDTYNRPNVTLIDVAASRGVEAMTERGFIHDGKEVEIDCLICASGFEVTSDLDRRWGIGTIEGRGGLSLFDHWADGYRTLHGAMAHGFPNLFFTGYVQGGFNATTIEQFSRQGFHAAWIVRHALDKGLASVDPTQAAQDEWVRTIRATAVDVSALQNECTPGYFNNDGDQSKWRWYLGESYGPGWDAFEALLEDWRARGDLSGMMTA